MNQDFRIWNTKTLLYSQAGNIVKNKHYTIGMKFIASLFLCWISFFIIKLIKLCFHCIHNVLLYITLKCSLKSMLGCFSVHSI